MHNEIRRRISKIYKPVQRNVEKLQERLTQKRSRYLRNSQESLVKTNRTIARNVKEMIDKLNSVNLKRFQQVQNDFDNW
jgi:hypothetical protein